MRQSSDTRSDEGRILLMSQMKLYNAAAYVHMYKHVNLSQEITGIRCRSLEKEGGKEHVCPLIHIEVGVKVGVGFRLRLLNLTKSFPWRRRTLLTNNQLNKSCKREQLQHWTGIYFFVTTNWTINEIKSCLG